MQKIDCPSCHSPITLPNCLTCPFCHRLMIDNTDALAFKHLKKCACSLNPNIQTHRCRGRPPRTEYCTMDAPDPVPAYKRSCRNCATRCSGNDLAEPCERWTIRPLDRCQHCGNLPTQVRSDGILIKIICHQCRLTMEGVDYRWCEEELTERWNRRLP